MAARPSIPSPPLFLPRRTLQGLAQWIVLGGMIATACAVLYLFDPRRHHFYPRCLLHEWTGLACPGCGSLRAAHQLLHGNLRAAFEFNPLLVCLLPFLALMAADRFHREWRGLPPRELFSTPWRIWAAFGLLIAFGILRNLPFYPLAKV
jgi:hypothetical protein